MSYPHSAASRPTSDPAARLDSEYTAWHSDVRDAAFTSTILLSSTAATTMVLYPTANELQQYQAQVAAFAAHNSQRSMASSQNGTPRQQTTPQLSQNQQDLLVAALNSRATGNQSTYPPTSRQTTSDSSALQQEVTMGDINGDALFMSPQQGELDSFNNDYTPDLDYLDGDSFDFENADLGGEMIGALPGSGELSNGAEQHEKRKNPDEAGDDEGDAKRQETQEGEKGAKKPGRKPLTNEPTTVS